MSFSVLRHASTGKFSGERTIGLTVAPWKFDVLKTSIFALEASLRFVHDKTLVDLYQNSIETLHMFSVFLNCDGMKKVR